ncbi:50S ribosomal protein L11 [[Mycoplasma] mobile]|uniref:Large ribosomal subunit protein uL11 n=1 Tax=Mycoplasma mobile (strain ATCC 43663 / 163K / NCTC 11711) TaxID=267748 RepID=RL11_MYCM1|nr:RecName: Full=Large ribosomal subunit protein uL11; AltName: Full=50S ribosomal protein L11 [Mycoplasma mobile 163K]
MAKKKEVVRVAKLQFNAGQAKPGPELAGLGIVMPEFTKQFNDATRERSGEPVPVQIIVYKDKSFDFKLFTAPTSFMLKKAAGIKSGSANSKTTIVATIKKSQLEDIAKYKMPDLNTKNLEEAMHTIAGTARNMGILVEGYDDIVKAREEAKLAAKEAASAAAFEAKLESDAAQLLAENKQSAEVEVIKEKDKGNKDE